LTFNSFLLWTSEFIKISKFIDINSSTNNAVTNAKRKLEQTYAAPPDPYRTMLYKKPARTSRIKQKVFF